MLILRLRREGRPEERLQFDKPEISLGRDGGNDVTLPDGSVSKFHALLARTADGVVVTDLTSTNGTYVNGTQIRAPVPVGEQDEIVIGDSLIHVDRATFATSAPPLAARPTGPPPVLKPNVTAGAAEPGPLAVTTAPTMPPLPPVPGRPRIKPRVAAPAPNADTIELAEVRQKPAARAEVQGAVEAAAPPAPDPVDVPPPPTKTAPGDLGVDEKRAAKIAGRGEGKSGKKRAKDPVVSTPYAGPAPALGPPSSDTSPPTSSATGTAPNEGIFAHATRLVERIAKAIDTEPLTRVTAPAADDDVVKKLDAVLDAEVRALGAPEPMAAQAVAVVRREFLDVGAVGPWLDDPEITRIECLGPQQIELTRGGRIVRAEIGYSSRTAMQRALRRLAKRSGQEWSKGELVVERRLPDGSRLVALLPPLAATLCMTIQKHERIAHTMAELVLGKALSEPMAELLGRAMQARANILVCGETERAVLLVCAALGAAAPASRRIAVLHAGRELRLPDRRTAAFALPTLPADEERTVRTAVQLGCGHTIALSPKASVAASAVVAMAAGGRGLVAGTQATSVARGLMNIAGQLMLARPGLAFDAACTLLSEGVDVAIEIGRGSGRGAETVPRIVRISQMESGPNALPLRDLFVLSGGDRQEPVFTGTGAASRLGLEG